MLIGWAQANCRIHQVAIGKLPRVTISELLLVFVDFFMQFVTKVS